MKTLARLTCIVAIVFLSACAGPSTTRHVSLDDGKPRIARSLVGEGIDVDVIRCLKHRSGRAFLAHSGFRQSLAGAAMDPSPLVFAQRQALRRVAAEIAMKIAVYQES